MSAANPFTNPKISVLTKSKSVLQKPAFTAKRFKIDEVENHELLHQSQFRAAYYQSFQLTKPRSLPKAEIGNAPQKNIESL